jgi:hypothetical protein
VQAPRATRASTNKITASRSTKRSKKSQEAEVSLEAHELTGSPDNVSGCTVLIFVAPSIYLLFFPCHALMKKFIALGTECTEYLKVAKAFEGEFFVLSLLVLYASLCFLFDFSFPFFVGLQML